MARALPLLDGVARRLTKGRRSFTESVAGLPTIQLTTTGARSGLPRTVPLLGIVDGDTLAVIGSNWGRPTHPAWVANLDADPRATVEWRGRSVPVTAREATGEQAQSLWAAARALYQGYAVYPDRAQGREIRVFVLEAR